MNNTEEMGVDNFEDYLEDGNCSCGEVPRFYCLGCGKRVCLECESEMFGECICGKSLDNL